MKSYRIFQTLVLAWLVSVSFLVFAEGGRIPTYAKNGIVTSASRLASEVGVDILKQGGNAVDASVATAFALAVTLPAAGNIGGGGFMIYHGADGQSTAFDFREKAPLAATERMYLGLDGQVVNNANHDGLLAVGVPGTVAGMYKAHENLGSLPWADLLEPAVRLARDGIPLSYTLASSFRRYEQDWQQYPSSAKVFLQSDGSFFEMGDTWRQPDLANTLELIQEHGKDGFYQGENAERLARFMRDNGGIITEADLDRYEAIEREPIRGTYRDYDIVSMSPPSSGGVTLVQMLNILEGYDLKQMGHNTADYLHLLTESMRRAYANRAEYLGDPDFNESMPITRMLDKNYAASIRSSIVMEQASPSDPSGYAGIYESEETTHYSVVDADGNMVSVTYTLEQGYGTKIVVDGGGYLLNNEMGDFNAVPGVTNRRGLIGTEPNLIAPEKRMLSSMTPTILAQNGKPVMAIGSPGGRTIINTTMQVILNVVDHGMNIAEAIEEGRIHHQWLPDITSFEEGRFSRDSLRLYEAKGHETRTRGTQGAAMGIWIDYEAGIYQGASDSRRGDGAAVGY